MSKIEFKNRRVSVSVGRTIKFGNDYEFFRFDLGMEADIPDDVSREEAHNQLFKELMEEVVNREAIVKAIGNDMSAMDMLVTLLKGLLKNKNIKQNKEEVDKNVFNLPPEFRR